MTDFVMVSLLSDDELDAVTGGSTRAVRSRVAVTVQQTAFGGFIGDFTVSGGTRNSFSNVGNTTNSSTVTTTSIAAVVVA